MSLLSQRQSRFITGLLLRWAILSSHATASHFGSTLIASKSLSFSPIIDVLLLLKQSHLKPALKLCYFSQSLPAFILDSEEDPIVISNLTPAKLPTLDQDKRKRQDQIDESDQQSLSIEFKNHIIINLVGQVKRLGYLLATSVRLGSASTKVLYCKSAKMPPLWSNQAC